MENSSGALAIIQLLVKYAKESLEILF